MKNFYRYVKNIGFSLFCLISFLSNVNATTVTIGTGTSYQRQPFGSLHSYERSAAIYTSTEIGGTGSITSIAYNIATSGTTTLPVKIYLKTTTSSIITSSTWSSYTTGATLVYSGNLTFPSTGWKTITLTTPFNYTGNNLLVLVEANMGSWDFGYPNTYYSATTSKHGYWEADGAPPTGNCTVNSSRPNIKITYTSCTAISSFPWSENFDALSSVGTDIYPNCWKEENGGWTSGNTASQSSNNPRSIDNYIYNSDNATNEYIWTPGFNLTAGTAYNFSFWFVGDGYAGWTGDVFQNTNQSSTGATQLGASFITSATVSSTTYAQVTRSFTPVSSGTYYFAIRINATTTPYYIGFDDFSLNIPITCSVPTTGATNVAFNSTCYANATVSWTRGDGDGCVVFMYQGNAGNPSPVDGTSYVASSVFGSGDQAGAGWYCVYKGTGTSVAVSGLNPITDYRVKVCEYKCTAPDVLYLNTSGGNNPNNYTTSNVLCPYCDANSTTCSDYISRVQIGSIDNASVCTSGGYANYTALSTTMSIGTGYTITVTNGDPDSRDYCGIWIDWNHDGDFYDANETITIDNSPGVGPYIATISPPVGSFIGSTRMRIRTQYKAYPTPYPCGTTSYGEVEDYTVAVVNGSCTTPGIPSIVSTTNISETGATLTWAAGVPGSAITSYYWAIGVGAGVTYEAGYIDRGITEDLTAVSTALTCNTSYYWAVKAYTSCDGTSSPYATTVGTFTTSACPPVPANDLCADAITITCPSSTAGTTFGATKTNDPTDPCGASITSPGVWYKYTGTGNNDLTISLCNSNTFDSKVSVYSGNCAALTCITGEDDDLTNCGDNDPYVTIPTANGINYFIFVHGNEESTGNFTLDLSCSPILVPNCPNLVLPYNGAINIGTASAVNWTEPSSGSTPSSYNVYFGTTNPPPFVTNTTSLSYSPPSMNTNTKYYWKVTALNANGESVGCSVRSFTTVAFSDLVVDNTTFNATDLVNNYLISGCLEAKNIKFTGNSHQIGYFEGGSNTIGYYSGLVLSSGNAKDAEGPNSDCKKTTEYNQPGDDDIDNIVKPNLSKDAAVLEFDFKPSSNNVSFRYTFASDEYNEWVNSQYNDAFGFFLTGTGYTNKNIALIPGTSTPVSINNVNNGTTGNTPSSNPLPPDYCKDASGPCDHCAYYRDNAPGGLNLNVECDGLTTVLTANATVTACTWYHIKMVVADVSDMKWDSWVFLEANSFSSGDGVEMALVNPTGTKTSYEGCTSSLTFTRLDTLNKSFPISVPYTIEGDVTAADYGPLTNPATIPAGEVSITVPLNTIIDGVVEGMEKLIVKVTAGGCPCNPIILRDTIFLNDFVGVNAHIQEVNQSICAGSSLTLHGILDAGNYVQYTWSSGGTFISHNQNISVTPVATTKYDLLVRDSCGNTDNSSVTLTLKSISDVPASVSATPAAICNGESSTLSITGGTLGTGATWKWYSGGCGLGASIGSGAPIIVSPTTTTTYYVRAEGDCNTTGCVNVEVTVTAGATVDAGPPQTICSNSTVTLDGTIGGGATSATWSGGTGTYNPNNTTVDVIYTPSAAEIAAGTVKLTLTTDDPAGPCPSVNDDVTITINDLPIVDAGANHIICADSSATLAGTIGGGATSATWSGGTGTYNPNNTTLNAVYMPSAAEITAGTVTLTLTTNVPLGPCPAVNDQVTITINPIPIAFTITGGGSYCSGGVGVPIGLNGSTIGVNYELYLNGTSTGVVMPGTGSALNFGNKTTAGTYTIIASLTSNGCTTNMTGNAVISINPLPASFIVNGGGSYCDGGIGLPVGLSGSSLGINYELYLNGSPTGNIISGTGNVISFGNQTTAGTYTVIAKSVPAGCTSTMIGSVSISIFENPTAFAGDDFETPHGTSNTLSGSATGGSTSYSYTWAPAAYLIDPNVQNPSTIVLYDTVTYYLTVTDKITGCIDKDTVILNVVGGPLQMISTTAIPDTICLGDSIQLITIASGGSGAYTYSWTSNPSGFASHKPNPYVTPTVTTDYFINLFDGFNTLKDTVTVKVNPLPLIFNVIASGVEYCNGGSGIPVSLDGSEIGVNYELYLNGTSTGIIVPGTGSPITFGNQTSAGTYTVVATNATTLCVSNMTGSASISINPNPIADAGIDQTIPHGSFTSLTGQASGGSGGPYIYAWTPSTLLNDSTLASPTTTKLLSTTTYTLQVQDIKGCTATDQVVIYITGGPLSINASATQSTICYGKTTQLTCTPTGGTGVYTYNWTSIPAGFTSNTQNPIVNPSTTTTYNVTVDDGCNTVSASVTIVVNSLPNANAGNDVYICNGNSIQLNASGGTSYSWSPGIGLNNNLISNPIANPTSNITYIVTVTDNNGCSLTDNVSVSIYPTVQANAGLDQTICAGKSAYLNASGGSSFVWSPNLYLNNNTIYNPVATPPITTTYTVVTTDINGCTTSDNVVVNVNPAVVANAGKDTTICNGNSIKLTATGGTSYSWSPSLGLSTVNIADPIANPAYTTTYVVTVTDINGCSATDNITITVNSLPNANAGPDVAICAGNQATLNASGGTIYIWNTATTTSSINVSPATTTTYTVTVSNSLGCSATDAATVIVNPLPNGDAGPSITICNHDSVSLIATGGTSYLWNNGVNNDTNFVKPNITTTYNVTVSDNNGCSVTDNVTVTVLPFEFPVITAIGPVTFCDIPVNTTLVASDGFASYLWSNGMTSKIINVTVSGNYYVTGFYANGCSGKSNEIFVGYYPAPIKPIIIADGPVLYCEDDTISVNFYTHIPYYKYNWNSGSVTRLIHVSHVGDYVVTVVDSNGCSSTSDTAHVGLKPKPVAYMNYVNQGTFVNYFNYSLHDITYLWDFGDGSTSTLENPSHSYDSSGTYTVTFVVFNECGSDTSIININANSGDGIDDITDIIHSLIVYPVPAKEMLHIAFETDNSKTLAIKILNTLGQTMYEEQLLDFSGKYYKAISCIDYPMAVYYLQIQSDKGTISKKLIIN